MFDLFLIAVSAFRYRSGSAIVTGPIDNDDVLVMVVVETGQLQRHVGQVLALDLQVGRKQADHLVLLEAGVDLFLAYPLGELSPEPRFGLRDAEIGHRHIVLQR